MRVTWSILTTRAWLATLLWLDFLVSGNVLPDSWTQMKGLKRGSANQEYSFTNASSANPTLKCLQCLSLLNRECVSGKVAPSVCKPGNKYCVKGTGDTDGFVYRSCQTEQQHGCKLQKMEGILINVCYHTCDTDGCNSALGVTSRSIHGFVSLALFCFYVLLLFNRLI